MSAAFVHSSRRLFVPLLLVFPVSAQVVHESESATTGLIVRTDAMGRRAIARRGGAERIEPAGQGLQAPHWRTLGPYGGDIDDVHASPANPQIVLAGLAPSSGA